MNESEFSVNLPTAEEQKLKLRLTVSIGVASLPEDGASVDEIIHKADSALYKAKSSGKNCVCGIS
jgi:diguanylate cyclase (GGDEF)-like protein